MKWNVQETWGKPPRRLQRGTEEKCFHLELSISNVLFTICGVHMGPGKCSHWKVFTRGGFTVLASKTTNFSSCQWCTIRSGSNHSFKIL